MKRTNNTWTDDFGQTLRNVHDRTAECEIDGCPIHSPSFHPLSDAKLFWCSDRFLIERICEHGVGHPDPDHIAFISRQLGSNTAQMEAIHGCDGCCSTRGLKE